MDSEKKCIKVTTPMDETMQKELDKTTTVLSITTLVISCPVLVVSIVFLSIGLFKNIDNTSWLIALLLSAFSLILGAYCYDITRKQLKKVRFENKVNEFEFYRNRAKGTIIIYGERQDIGTLNYYELHKTKEKKNYFLIPVPDAANIPICKRGLTQEELNTLRSIFQLPLKGMAQPLELDMYTEGN